MLFLKNFHRFNKISLWKATLPMQFSILTLLLYFCYPKQCVQLAKLGLLQWYEKILPVLLPFMIFTSIIRFLHIDEQISKYLHFLQYIYRNISSLGHYIMILGFCCGFPMGAKLVSDYVKQEKVNLKEAQCLLCFCNNISPAFFIGIVYPVIQNLFSRNGNTNQMRISIFPFFLIMYGVPLLYGFFLQILLLKSFLQFSLKDIPSNSKNVLNDLSFPEAFDCAISDNILPIVKIGGYLMVFQIANIIPQYILPSCHIPNLPLFQIIFACALEITNGTLLIGQCNMLSLKILLFILYFFLEFGGFSCIMQTFTFISGSKLSIKNYMFHKCMMGIIAGIMIYIYVHFLFK